MKNLLYTIIFIVPLFITAQSPTENYIKTTTYTAPSTGVITENDTLVSVTYFDGLGRARQTVAVRAGGQGQDIVSPIVYDGFGRQTKEYLPYATATQNGNIHIDPIAELEEFYNIPKYGNTTNPYSEKILENSPLNRVMKQGAPGADWMADPLSDTDHSIKFSYGANATDEVRLYKATTTADSYGSNLSTYIPVLENPGFYDAGRLYKTTVKDENWQPGDGSLHTSEEFKDFQGRVVLKRTYNNPPPSGELEGAYDTYYVYDKFSNLSYVIPPKVNTGDGVSPEELSELCYQYIYDHRNRLVEKKIPGKGWESIVYNKLDLPVFTQDQNMADNGQWLFTKYDKFSRVVYTGIFSSTDSREALQTTVKAHTPLYEDKTDTPTLIDGTEVYYTNVAFPAADQQLLTINYYDTYNFDLDGAVEEDAYGITPTTKTKTLSTGNKTRVLGTDHWITTVTYYDKKARPIYSYSKNPYLNTTDKIKYKLDFIGKVLETTSVHTKDGAADITSIDKFSYDPVGRLLKHTHQLAGQVEEVLAENVYDALGQLIQKKTGNTTAAPLQTVDYSYNIRGWLTGINDVNNIGNDLFSFGISYNDPANGVALYNGNISQALWRTNNTDASLKDYTYSYDGLNRITAAIDNTGNYNLNSLTYDKNGNILNLSRQGHINEAADNFGVMDDLTYSYDNGNKLLKVEDVSNDSYGFKDDAVAVADNSDDYSYDVNGNMISDTNKGITSILYNHLNLPTEIVFNNDQSQKISYFYTANGIKQQKVVDDNAAVTTTDYAGSYIYENSSLKFFNHPEGYIEPDGTGGYDYVYQYKDHLGNIRLSYSDNSTVLTDNSFDSTTENWGVVAAVLSQENGKLKAEVTGQWAGAQKYVDVAVGDSIYYELLIDKATTSKLALLLIEHDVNYLTLKTTIVNPDADGFLSGTYTVTQGSRLRLKVAKDDGGDLGITTHYYLDDVKMIKKDIAIREESNYYPFGLKHKGYNNLVNGTENKFLTYNGVELEESLGLNMYEMDLRHYDSAIARWIVMDPVTHHSMSPYSAFDNNPVFWADPSGADAVYNWDDGKYYDNDKEVSYERALASHGVNNSGESGPPTKFVNEEGETIADTDDGSNEVFVIQKENEGAFTEDLKKNIETKDDLNVEKNEELGNKYGYNLKDITDNIDNGLDHSKVGIGKWKEVSKDNDFGFGYHTGYDSGLNEIPYQGLGFSPGSNMRGIGKSVGKRHRKEGKMNMLEPKLKNNKPSIRTNKHNIPTPNYNITVNGFTVNTFFPNNQ